MDYFENFESFKRAFIDQFWSETQQLEVKLKLQSSKFINGKGTFVEHFMYYVSLGKHLDQRYSENLLIQTIARHYPPNISAVLVGTNTFCDAMDRLIQADYYFDTANTRGHQRETENGNIGQYRKRNDFSFRNESGYEQGKQKRIFHVEQNVEVLENGDLGSENGGQSHKNSAPL